MEPPRLTIVPREEIEERSSDEEATTADGASAAVPAAPRAAPSGRHETVRMIEALLFAASEPLSLEQLERQIKTAEPIGALLDELAATYAGRGVNLVKVAGKWAFRTAEDLSFLLERHAVEQRRLSRAALETLSIIAYHQPVTRAEIEEIRGVQTSKGTLDVLLETGWIRPRGRRRAPGKPLTYGTTEAFLDHFGLDTVKELPGLSDLKGAGLLDANLPPDFKVPEPRDVAALMPDELPLEDSDGAEEEQSELPLDLPEEGEEAIAEEAKSEETRPS